MSAPDLSLLGLVLQAGPVVQGVMALLLLASLACWAIAIEKAILLGRLSRQMRRLAAAEGGAAGEGLAAEVQRAAAREWSGGRDPGESRAEYRERIERAMRDALSAGLRGVQGGLPLLATTGAVAPFIGLFGTVWGIMGSFQGIAQAHDTSLAVVAPGIAEALLATAIGLLAAIPAVIAYNRLILRFARLRQEGMTAIGAIGARLSARPPQAATPAAAA
ncbi:MotA/TolQ/ExbB proton channel family protein [Falsiroseomonas sp. CW058]|uniref:MotA/TolQ/ExbB proton channel family protein n=1 Tax=Falsiroseomonas sp. CW058 TaxID=3388664 RepID=UPI003D31A1DC